MKLAGTEGHDPPPKVLETLMLPITPRSCVVFLPNAKLNGNYSIQTTKTYLDTEIGAAKET